MAEPKVCVTLEGTTVKEMGDEAARANIAGAEFVEVRFDRLYLVKPQPVAQEDENGEIKHVIPPEDEWHVKDAADVDVGEAISTLKESIPLPVIFTVRPTVEGGHFPGTDEERMAILEAAIESNVNSVDLELSIEAATRARLVDLAAGNGVKVISSIHNTTTTPSAEELVNMVKEHATEEAMFKFCGTVNDHQDALQIVEACYELNNTNLLYALMALGNGGDWGRLHAPALGQALVYATLRNEFKLSNKGLVNVKDLKRAWTLMEY